MTKGFPVQIINYSNKNKQLKQLILSGAMNRARWMVFTGTLKGGL